MAVIELGSSYSQYSPGQTLAFTQHFLNPNGKVNSGEREIKIAAIKGGGFFGRVLIPDGEEFVIKTSVPDPWHDLWRRVNWGFRDFPSQVDETQAKLDQLASNLIADTLPIVTDGKFIAPHSLGYTKLPNGYAQVIERMYGRPPKYDVLPNEFTEFRQAQKELREIGFELGLEQAAQIHEDNPFGMANLWKDPENNRWIWLDTLPAIPHKGLVWPFFNFRFHKDVRNWFYPNQPDTPVTFNRIHLDRLMSKVVDQRKRFEDQDYNDILANIETYDQLIRVHTPDKSVNLAGTAKALAQSCIDGIEKLVSVPINTVDSALRVIISPAYRRSLVLDGVEKANDMGLITDKELKEANSVMDNHLENSHKSPAIMAGLYAYYQGLGLVLKPLELFSYASLVGVEGAEKFKELGFAYLADPDGGLEKMASCTLAFVSFRAAGSIIRPLTTKLVGHISGVEVGVATPLSVIPLIGDHLAVPAQIASSARGENEKIWHYTVRNLVAKASSIFPDGGWGSEREGRWWKKWGKKLESLGKTSSSN